MRRNPEGNLHHKMDLTIAKSIVPITRFNKGEASRIFDEVKEAGFKFVVKYTAPKCVLLSTELFEEIQEALADYQLLLEAEQRMESVTDDELLSEEEVMKALDINEDDLIITNEESEDTAIRKGDEVYRIAQKRKQETDSR